jgi:chaperonin GroES
LKPNPSGIVPVEYKCLIRPVIVEEKTKGGIIVPDQVRERDQYAVQEGEIVAVSPLAFTYHDPWPDEAVKPKAGDRVLFAKYAGGTRKGADGVEYRLINDRDISAVLA